MSTTDHEHASELLGAFSLDAVDGDDARFVEEHLTQCAQCRGELDDHRETAALLGTDGDTLPLGLWTKIESELTRDDVAALSGGVTDIAYTRRSRQRRVASLVYAGVAAALIVVMAFGWASANGRANQLQGAEKNSALALAVDDALQAPGHKTFHFSSLSGAHLADVVLTRSGTGYIYRSSMPALSSNQTYQLWFIGNGAPVSIGLMGSHPHDVTFAFGGFATSFTLAVTVEPRGGVTAPTSPPVTSLTYQA